MTVIKKYEINTYNHCQVLNMNMQDSTGTIRVSAFNALSDHMNNLFGVYDCFKDIFISINGN